MKNLVSTFLETQKSKRIWSQRKREGLVPLMGEAQILSRGHRNYVGGKWETLGKLQLEFLRGRGLKPHHVLYDIACGSLRAGVFLIPYLEAGNYLGIEKEGLLVKKGVEEELGIEQFRKKSPEFLINDEFAFHRFTKAPDYAIAQSLFTHLTLRDIRKCLAELLKVATEDTRFFATFDEIGTTDIGKKRRDLPNPPKSHSNISFFYTRSEIEDCGRRAGWNPEYIGDWGHPSNQRMMLFRPAPSK